MIHGASLGVPAYFYPGPQWNPLVGAADVLAWVVANPGSGPGDLLDPVWLDQVGDLRTAGIRVIGYLDIAYGASPRDELARQCERWRRWYQVDEMFLDRVPASAGDWLPRWRTVESLTASSAVVANTGAACDRPIWNAFESVCDSEHSGPTQPLAERSSRTQRVVIRHGTPPDAVLAVAEELMQAADVVWVSDLAGTNPYRALPRDFDAVVTLLRHGETPEATPVGGGQGRRIPDCLSRRGAAGQELTTTL